MSETEEDIPVVEGYIYAPERRLVVPKCPYCERPHLHGLASDERIGVTTHRVSHCSLRGYFIKIVGFLTREEYRKIERKLKAIRATPIAFSRNSFLYCITETSRGAKFAL